MDLIKYHPGTLDLFKSRIEMTKSNNKHDMFDLAVEEAEKLKSELEDFIESKVNKLIKNHNDVIGAEIILKLENTPDLENKVAEIKIEIPGNDLFAKKQSNSFESSTDTAVEALRRQLKKHKEKLRGR